jgi:hypothetical protein
MIHRPLHLVLNKYSARTRTKTWKDGAKLADFSKGIMSGKIQDKKHKTIKVRCSSICQVK